eukprot:5920371-Lingulodinium_polyedra.AAC.1
MSSHVAPRLASPRPRLASTRLASSRLILSRLISSHLPMRNRLVYEFISESILVYNGIKSQMEPGLAKPIVEPGRGLA